jgi:hypothetical protein
MITFTWGKTVTFKAVADNLSVQYLLFRPDGSPIRAQAKLSLIQVEKAQDKSSGAGGGKGKTTPPRALLGSGSHVVRDGDSLPSIAYTHYHDLDRWRVIAEANGIDDPLRLRRGTTLRPKDRRMISGSEVRTSTAKALEAGVHERNRGAIQENLRLPDAR